ncbi:hypothetical protein XACS584_690033 [Xanthomonas citri pv. citri]|nr:hypothetical protein XACS584_690033 [Xanthomonas citri pv. citri]
MTMRTLVLHIATTQFCLGTNTNIPTSSPARALAEDGGELRTRTLAFAKKESNKRITVIVQTLLMQRICARKKKQ